MEIEKALFEREAYIGRPDYYQGAGVAGTSWTGVVVGVGMSSKDAHLDAIEQLAEIANIDPALEQNLADIAESADETIVCEIFCDGDEEQEKEACQNCTLTFMIPLYYKEKRSN